MVTPDLLSSWSRTVHYLLQAKALITPTPATTVALDEVTEFLEHNELGIASDWLRSIAEETNWESVEILQLLALAEASMGRSAKQQVLDQRLTQLLGHIHETKLHAV
jgi:hypothetical protein